jgi:hypothetical protein
VQSKLPKATLATVARYTPDYRGNHILQPLSYQPSSLRSWPFAADHPVINSLPDCQFLSCESKANPQNRETDVFIFSIASSLSCLKIITLHE